jgi:hypothetical protein
VTTLLAVFTCSSCSAALIRHWPYFLRQQADRNIIIATIDKPCRVPDDVERLDIGGDSYISGPHLPKRMLDVIDALIPYEWDALILAEYDTLILNRIEVENLNGIAACVAGHINADQAFYHNPWVLERGLAKVFVKEGEAVITEGHCQDGSHAASPDVFFGLVCKRLLQPVQSNLWTEFTRNSLDCEGDLERARVAYLAGIDVIHGCKTAEELEYITK